MSEYYCVLHKTNDLLIGPILFCGYRCNLGVCYKSPHLFLLCLLRLMPVAKLKQIRAEKAQLMRNSRGSNQARAVAAAEPSGDDSQLPPQFATTVKSSTAAHSADALDSDKGASSCESDGEDEIEELCGAELVQSLVTEFEVMVTLRDALIHPMSAEEWRRSDQALPKTRNGAHTGQSSRTRHRHNHDQYIKDKGDAVKQNTSEVDRFNGYFGQHATLKPQVLAPPAGASLVELQAYAKAQATAARAALDASFLRGLPVLHPRPPFRSQTLPSAHLVHPTNVPLSQELGNKEAASESHTKADSDALDVYGLDLEFDDSEDTDLYESEERDHVDDNPSWEQAALGKRARETSQNSQSEHMVVESKRQRLEVPVRIQRAKEREAKTAKLTAALKQLDQLIASRKTTWQSGQLQEMHVRAVRATLDVMVEEQCGIMTASHIGTKANGFHAPWAMRMVRCWTRQLIATQTLPESERGRHAKLKSILSDPTVLEGIRAYMRSHKWSQSPGKLHQLLKNELAAPEAREYVTQITTDEMPHGLRVYLEQHVLPQFHLKPTPSGLSLSRMRRLLISEGFEFTEYHKAVYFDGHERPDVVNDRTNRFIPMMKLIRPQLVQYKVGSFEEELETADPSRPKLVLVAHDEMAAQAHDGTKWGWVMRGEQPLRKKGAGRGIHQSEFICSTVGHLKDAGVTLEYGKNHGGFWNGQMFVDQVCQDRRHIFASTST